MLVCALPVHIARETAGAARTRSSLRPQIGEGGMSMEKLAQILRRDRGAVLAGEYDGLILSRRIVGPGVVDGGSRPSRRIAIHTCMFPRHHLDGFGLESRDANVIDCPWTIFVDECGLCRQGGGFGQAAAALSGLQHQS